MASLSRVVRLPAPADQVYLMLRTAGSELPGFKLSSEHAGCLNFSRGFGWTNPVDVQARVVPVDEANCEVHLASSIIALVDLFGFLPSVLGMFETHLLQHHQAWLSGVAPPPPPKDSHAVKVNLILIGIVLVFIFCVFGFIALLAITR